MKHKYFVSVLIYATIIFVVACKEKQKTPEPKAETPEPVCFNSNSIGNYKGYGSIMTGSAITTFTTGTVTVNKTACNTVYLSLTSPAGNRTEIAKDLVLNSSSVYEGTIANGNAVTMQFGSHLIAKAVGSFTFTGVKQ